MAATTATAVVSQLIGQGRQRFGVAEVEAVEVPRELWEQVLDEVAAAGGEVGFDHCVVDGVAVRAQPDGDDRPAVFHVAGRQDPQPLPSQG